MAKIWKRTELPTENKISYIGLFSLEAATTTALNKSLAIVSRDTENDPTFNPSNTTSVWAFIKHHLFEQDHNYIEKGTKQWNIA